MTNGQGTNKTMPKPKKDLAARRASRIAEAIGDEPTYEEDFDSEATLSDLKERKKELFKAYGKAKGAEKDKLVEELKEVEKKIAKLSK